MSSSSTRLPAKIPVIVLKKEVLLPTAILRVSCAPNTANWHLAHDVIWNANKKAGTTVIGVIPGFVGAGPPAITNGEHDSSIGDADELNSVGCAARVVKIVRVKSKGRVLYTILLEGLARIEAKSLVQYEPYVVAEVTLLVPSKDGDIGKLIAEFKAAALRLVELLRERVPLVAKFQPVLDSTPPEKLCDMFVSAIDATFEERLTILNEVELGPRFEAGLQLLKRQLLVLSTAGALVGKERSRSTIKFRDAKKSKANRADDDDELAGASDADPEAEQDDEDTVARLERRIQDADMPETALRVAKRELKKIKDMERSQSLGPEHQKVVSYVQWLVDLPWSRSTKLEQKPDLALARKTLDDDHYGLEKIKRRIIEYTAVHWLNPEKTATILCLVGPPGVGKTSLGKSIAHTLGREFHRISLGGVHDEADIRGFNRTYVGSQPGRIIQGLKEAKSNDPVLLLDEIDKMSMGSSATGNPLSALLEVLDPAQNNAFVDRYISVPFDLSKVLFIATANSLDTIPGPLFDRMEVIHIAGYTLNEKLQIAKKYIVPRQMTQHGLTKDELTIPQDTLATIGEQYTLEAGVRSFERQVAAVCRAAAVKMIESGRLTPKDTSVAKPVADAKDDDTAAAATAAGGAEAAEEAGGAGTAVAALRGPPMVIKEETLIDILGPPQFETNDLPANRVTSPGIAIGLAANAMGGTLLFIEATSMPGNGHVKLTGSLGDVIQESAHIALGWLRSHSAELGLSSPGSDNFMSKIDLHIHFPEGAVGKDGPSAGVTLTTALASLLTNRLVRNDTAMTGELTLSGTVLPVGGITAKVLAAYRQGIKRIILPQLNYLRNLNDVPKDVRDEIEFIPVTRVDTVLKNALVGGFSPTPVSSFSAVSKL